MKAWVRGYKGMGFGSSFIKWFTFGSFSHVTIVLDVGHDTQEFEALQGKGVIKHEPTVSSSFIEYELPLTEEQILEAWVLLCTTVSCETKYDWWGIAGFMMRRDKHSPYKYFCSELVAYVCYKVGYKLSRREPYRETPTSVMESLRLLEPTEEQGSA